MIDTAKLIIRTECITDFANVGAIHARAFGNRPNEALIVALLRHRRAFDPELSLVAEIDGRVVGHALFSPYQMRLLDQAIPTVNLAPIAVDPLYQGRGIGGQLITAGHTVASAKGYTVSVLLGHTSYYPRFGYHTHAFGSAQVTLSVDTLPNNALEVRGPTDEDVPALCDLWRHEESAVDMALEPGPDLLDWLSPNPAVQSAVYTRDGEVVGYTRIHVTERATPRVFLACDSDTARAMVATIARKLGVGQSGSKYILPLHPSSASAQAFGGATCVAWATAMACSLVPSPLESYLAQVREGRRLPGRVVWPVAFDID